MRRDGLFSVLSKVDGPHVGENSLGRSGESTASSATSLFLNRALGEAGAVLSRGALRARRLGGPHRAPRRPSPADQALRVGFRPSSGP